MSVVVRSVVVITGLAPALAPGVAAAGAKWATFRVVVEGTASSEVDVEGSGATATCRIAVADHIVGLPYATIAEDAAYKRGAGVMMEFERGQPAHASMVVRGTVKRVVVGDVTATPGEAPGCGGLPAKEDLSKAPGCNETVSMSAEVRLRMTNGKLRISSDSARASRSSSRASRTPSRTRSRSPTSWTGATRGSPIMEATLRFTRVR